MKDPIIVIDFETTGIFDQGKFPIPLEIGCVKLHPETYEVLGKYESLIQTPGIENNIPEFIVNYTGITADAVVKDGKPIDEVCERLIEFCNGNNSILSAWPISYEIPLLQYMFSLAGYKNMPLSRRAIDIGTLFRFSPYYKEHMKAPNLDIALKSIGLVPYGRHRAMPDAEQEALLLSKLLEHYNGKN